MQSYVQRSSGNTLKSRTKQTEPQQQNGRRKSKKQPISWPLSSLKARQMVLEASRQHIQARSNGNQSQSTSEPPFAAALAEERCKHCKGRHPTDKCWIENPEDAPSWFENKMKEMAKEKRNKGRQARKFQVKRAVVREDNFTDNQGIHFSA